jgi:uncharacterized protein with HEPN domain
MSKRDPLVTLDQMRSFAIEASNLASQVNRERLDSDLSYRRLAERIAELVGESATRLPDALKEKWPAVPWKQIIGLRNWLIHGYDGIDTEILWDVLSLRSAEVTTQLENIIHSESE